MIPSPPWAPGGTGGDAQERDPSEADLDGHTIEELSEYLDRGRTPADPSIDESPGCRIALAALVRLRTVSQSLLEADAEAEAAASVSERDDRWVRRILGSISRDAHAGRDIPVRSDDPRATLVLTEGAVRGMVRAAGDGVGGVLLGRCRLDGDVTVPGNPIGVFIEIILLLVMSFP